MNRIWVCIAAVATAMAGLVTWTDVEPAPFVINESASLPRGLYVRAQPRLSRGALVTLLPPPSTRTYVDQLGVSPDAQLLKRVVAVGGDQVCAREGRLIWPTGQAEALSQDRRGRPLVAWNACRRLGQEELLVMGDTAASFDSRYFGPVSSGSVTGVYREAWTW